MIRDEEEGNVRVYLIFRFNLLSLPFDASSIDDEKMLFRYGIYVFSFI